MKDYNYEINYKIDCDVLNKTCLGVGHLKLLKFFQFCGILMLVSLPMTYELCEMIPGFIFGYALWIILPIYLTFFSKRIKAIRLLNKALYDYENKNYTGALFNIKQSFAYFALGRDEKSSKVLSDWVKQLEYIIS